MAAEKVDHLLLLKVNKNLHQMAITLTEKRLSENTVRKAEQELLITSASPDHYVGGAAAGDAGISRG